MDILFLTALGFIIAILLFLIEPKKEVKLLFINTFLGVIGAIIGGVYAQVFFGIEFNRLGINGYLIIIFVSVLLWFLGRAIRQVK